MKSRPVGSRRMEALSAEDRSRHAQIRRQIEGEKPEIMAKGRAIKAGHETRLGRLREAVAAIKEERERQGLSLSEVAVRAGIDKANLSRLETGTATSCTVDTLQRYAAAVGKEVVVTLVDCSAA